MSASWGPTGFRGALARLGSDLRRLGAAFTRVRPRRSVGAVQGPLEASRAGITAFGWAYSRRDPVTSVVVSVDGRPAALARLEVEAPDALQRRRGAERCGWVADVDLRGHAGQRVVLGAVAITASGVAESLTPMSVEVHHEEIMRLRVVRSVSPDVLVVSGITASEVPPARVEVMVDGRVAGRARTLSVPTPGLVGLTYPHAALAGFALMIEDPAGGASATRVEALVRFLDGSELRLGPVEVAPGTPSPPAVDVEPASGDQRAVTPLEPPAALRVLAVTHSLKLGGGQLYFTDLLRVLVQELDLSCVVVAPSDGPLRPALEQLGITVQVSGELPVADPSAYESKMADLMGVAHDHGSNLVVANTMGCQLGPDLAQRMGLPSVWAIHESFPPPVFWAEAYGPEGYHPYVRERGLAAIRSASALVFDCDATRRLFEPYADRERLVAWPYSIGLDEIDAYGGGGVRAKRAEADDEVRFLVVGTFEPRKAQSRIAIAFAEIADEHPEARLTMVGLGHDDYSRGVEDIVERLGFGDRIELLPVEKDIYRRYATADALVSASDVESLPRSVLEAMAFELPVVAAAVYGLPEVITDGVDGLLFEPGDTSALINGLRRFLELDPSERAKLGRVGGQRVRAAFAASEWARPWTDLLQRLVKDPRATPTASTGP